MKKRLMINILMMMLLFSSTLSTSASNGLNNGGVLDTTADAGDAINWDAFESDYYVKMANDVKTISVGEKFQMDLCVYSKSQGQMTDVKIIWSSDDSGIASVDKNGVVTGVSVGRIHINASTMGYKVTCVVTVVENTEAGPDTPSNEEDSKTEVYFVKSVSISKISFVYNGKEQKPSVKVVNNKGDVLKKNTHYTVTYGTGSKNVGTYSAVVKFKGEYKDTKDSILSYEIVPKGTTLKGLIGGKKKISITWKKQTKQVNGYQLQCSLKKNFKSKVATVNISGKKKTKVMLTGLKAKKKYFVRIRTYKNIKSNGKTVKMYSDWSDAKKIKIK